MNSYYVALQLQEYGIANNKETNGLLTVFKYGSFNDCKVTNVTWGPSQYKGIVLPV